MSGGMNGVYVTNIPRTFSDERLKSIFEEYGRIDESSVNDKYNTKVSEYTYGFVYFHESSDCQRLLDYHDVVEYQGM
jgi:RNA recognition motif-containing protein